MSIIETIENRHSVRSYQDKKIAPELVESLKAKIEELNAKGNLKLQLLEDAGKTFQKLLTKVMGLGSAPSVIACVGKKAPDLEERIGYYGEKLVLYAQELGLNTCWAGTFSRKLIPVTVEADEEIVIAIAIGYGNNQGRVRKSKTADQVTSGSSDRPDWFDFGVQMALLAPTAINQQKFDISYQSDGTVTFTDKGGPFSKIDIGIVKCHFDIGAEYKKAE